jgi:hypothetical protein
MQIRSTSRVRQITGTVASLVLGAGVFVLAQTPSPSSLCVVSGRVTSAGTPLPGVSIVASRGSDVVSATSTDTDGGYRLRVPPGEYTIAAELIAFAKFERPLAITPDSCTPTLDVALGLISRTQPNSPAAAAPASADAGRGGRFGGRGQQPGQSRFAQLEVVQSESAAASAESVSASVGDEPDPAARLLPPGFAADAATSVVAVTGDAATVDRGQLRDRVEAFARGEFAAGGFVPPEGFAGRFGGDFAGGFPGGQDFAGFIGRGGGGGRGDGGRGGNQQGARGGNAQGGRGGNAQAGRGGGRGGGNLLVPGRSNRIQGSANYTFGGSALDAAPYPLRANTLTDPDYTRQQFGASIGGALRIPGVYDGSRSTFFLDYSGGRNANLYEQYATVPSEAIRQGDFSGIGVSPIDPATGAPFADGRIPGDRLDPSSLALLQYIPLPNLPGNTQNYRRVDTSSNVTDNISLRVTHNFGSAAAGRRGGGGGGRGGGFQGRGAGAAGGRGFAGALNAQVQYRRNGSDQLNVFPLLGGVNQGDSWSVPVTLNLLHNRTIHNVQVNATRSYSNARNHFAYVSDVAGDAGIGGVATDPSEWGLPNLSFSSLTGVRDVAPSRRSDSRFQLSYSMTRPFDRHSFRAGGDFRFDSSSGLTNNDARGTLMFTGLYSAGGPVRSYGLDFADFLLGMPQQATVQYTDEVVLKGRAFNLFVQDDWRWRGNLTLNLGARYEAVRPYTEENGQMVNLDVAPDFTGAVPVMSGESGIYTGAFPAALVYGDYNNIAPRVGLAWRMSPRTVVRGGYSIGFNNGAYSSIARQLTAQPPFAVTNTALGSASESLTMSDPFANVAPDATTNNFGIDKNYKLGVIHTWNVDMDRNLLRGWQLGGGYTATKGALLDLLRAPNRDPLGLRIEGVQPFIWQSSEGSSLLHAGTVRLRRQQSRGIAGQINYTIARSMDDASSIGGGARVVAQNDRDLEAEWGRSSFDQLHQFSGNLSVELPFGANRQWLNQGGPWAAVLTDWTLSASFTAASGNPFTARILGAASDVARGTYGTLRADYDGDPISIDDPDLLQFFNTSAFALPPPGRFGSAARNTIVGPANTQFDASIGRDVRLTNNQTISIRVQGTNLFNSVRFGGIDTTVNSPTFGQVVSIRPMRSVGLNVRFRF